eukprot:5154039-Karenia_brevis.AAC.1
MMRVVVPTFVGIRMCFACPLATALGFSVEYTKDGSPHGHGLVSLNRLYSTRSLLDIAQKLKANSATKGADLVDRVKNFIAHLQRSKRCTQEQDKRQEAVLEVAFEQRQDES